MTKINKISIRFFDDREVRAIWDDENSNGGFCTRYCWRSKCSG